jgi:hypothetical protein
LWNDFLAWRASRAAAAAAALLWQQLDEQCKLGTLVVGES